MDRKEAAEILYEKYSDNEFYYAEYDKYPKGISDEYQIALDIAIAALKEPEIVHCKDCRLRKTEDCAMQYECDCGEQHSWENDNDYCSWGIKAGEENG